MKCNSVPFKETRHFAFCDYDNEYFFCLSQACFKLIIKIMTFLCTYYLYKYEIQNDKFETAEKCRKAKKEQKMRKYYIK